MRALKYPRHLLVTTNADMKSDAVMASSRPLASLRESVDHFPGPSSKMLSIQCNMSQLIGASSEMSVERRSVASNVCDRGHPASSS